MKRFVIKLLLFAGMLILAGAPAVGQQEALASAEIEIVLPEGSADNVSVLPSTGGVTVELPRGSVFPMDFDSATGGLLRSGGVEALDGGRVRLELEMARGVLEAVEFRPGAVTLRFVSRFDPLMAGTESDEVYRIGPDDELKITVYNQANLSTDVTVSSDGNITMPVLGKVRAEGLSQRDLTVRITELLGQGILVNPQVDVGIEEYRNQWVMVTGEVRNPGRHALRGGTTLKEVLAEAMGFTEKSGEGITISRRIAGTDDFKKFDISRSSFEIGGVDPTMSHGDIVEVSRATYCYIHGEVRSPSRVPVERGMTLLKAITSVGGLTEWADRKEVRILPAAEADANGQPVWEGRSAKGARGRVVNLRRIQAGLEPDPVLKGGEIVYVKRRYF